MTDTKKNKRIKPLRPEGILPSCLPGSYPCKLDKDSIKIAKYLLKLAETRAVTTYKETGKLINVGPRSPKLFIRLGIVSWVTYHNAKVLLSVLVVRKKEKTPGNGFFKLEAAFRKTPYPKPVNEVRESFNFERNKVYNAAKKLNFMRKGKTFNDRLLKGKS